MSEERVRPSKVFATRLREVRKARDNMSQTELAQRMTEQGRPMSKAALLRIESGERGISLDEAIAFAAVLHVAPAHLLSRRDDEIVWLTDTKGVDGGGMRAWLLHGDEFVATASEYQRGKRAAALERIVLAHAKALVDADRGRDVAGAKAEMFALAKKAMAYAQVVEQIEAGKKSS